MFKVTGLILLGVVLGWVLNDSKNLLIRLIDRDFYTVENKIDSGKLEKSEGGSGVEQNRDGASSAKSDSGVVDSSPQSNFLEHVSLGDLEQSISTCSRLKGKSWDSCRKWLLVLRQSDQMARSDANNLLTLWIAENPADVEIGILLAQQTAVQENFHDAIEMLASLYGYQIDQANKERVLMALQKIASSAIIKLTLTENFVSLRSIYNKLINIGPERADLRYSLAKVEYDLKDYEAAANTLTYILYDSEYGGQATQLYEDVLRKINLAHYNEIPLIRSGAHFLVNVKINGSRDLALLLDTGASISAIDTRVLKSMGLLSANNPTISLHTAGGVIQSRLIRLNTLSLGGQSYSGLSVASLDSTGDQYDGLLGMDFLENYRFFIDQKQERLYLNPK